MPRFIGIDLGTTYSAVSTIDEYGRPEILKNSEGERLTPSVIYFDPDGTILVGARAKEMMQNAGADVAAFFKRLMGDKGFAYEVNGNRYTATELSTILLKKLREDAELSLGGPIHDAVITVPAYFNDLQRNETKRAAADAGLNVLRIINEPTAAAITYGIDQQTDSRLLVYDLGGGTFDVTVLEVHDGVMHVLATGGDHKLGGKDWDDCIVNYVANLFKNEHGCNPLDDPETFSDLLLKAETAKKQLSSLKQTIINLRYNGCRGKYTITRDMFEHITSHLMHNTQQKTEEVLKEAKLTWSDLSGVLLVGGSTKMAIVSEWVREMSGKEPLRGVNVDEAVCLGAGIQASIDIQKREKQLGLPGASDTPKFGLPSGIASIQDVMSHSLGTISKSEDGSKYENSIIIEKNKTIPITAKRSFYHITHSVGSNDIEIYLTQGESTDVHEVVVVSKYVLCGIQHIPGCETNIEIEYSYDEDGIINVSGYQVEKSIKLEVRKEELPEDMDWLYKQPMSKAVPYSKYAGISLIPGVETDKFGNPLGSQYDLAKDGAFEGYTIVIADLCGIREEMKDAIKALEKKGFSVAYFKKNFLLRKIRNLLDDNKSQLWIIAGEKTYLTPEHHEFIYDCFYKGRGLYLWSDNAPFFADTNIIISKLFKSKMSGEYYGCQVLSLQTEDNGPGIIRNHLITTGVQNFYEGHTISNVKINGGLKPLVFSSDGLVVTAYYDTDGKRCLVDGGFTRLFWGWDTAGTDRFVVNCAAWLANIERFGYYPKKSTLDKIFNKIHLKR